MSSLFRSRVPTSVPPRLRCRGGTCSTTRRDSGVHLATVVIAAAVCLQLGAPRRAAASAPTVSDLLRGATLVGIGRVTGAAELDHGRIRIHDLVIDDELKPGEREGARTVRVVSITDEPGAALIEPGSAGVAFVRPLRRNSYLDAQLESGAMYQFVEQRAGWLQSAAPEQLTAIAAPIQQLIDSSRNPGRDAATRQAGRRALVFAMLAAPHPLLIANGVADLSAVPELASSLSSAEAATLTTVLNDTALPTELRTSLIAEIGALGLRAMVESLQQIREPALQEATWAALRQLGAPVADEELRDRLAATDPGVRLAAASELLKRDGAAAVPLVSSTILRDPDPQVRLGVIEALGATGSAAAVPPLEIVFAGDDVEERQATARALREIGGDPAIEALHRLAFKGSIDAQRYAVIVLMTLNVPRDDARVQDIARRHKDREIQTMLEHGLEAGHGH